MNHFCSADRTTHLKVVIVALIAGILVAGFGISMRNSSDEGWTQTARVMKAGKPGDGHNVEQKRKIVKAEDAITGSQDNRTQQDRQRVRIM